MPKHPRNLMQPRVPHQRFERETWLEGEEFAYPSGRELRRGRAVFPDGEIRAVYAGIPDTYFSIPAHARVKGTLVSGYVTVDDKLVTCPKCKGENWRDCATCQFGLVEGPTYGSLVFHISQESQQRLDAATNERESSRA